MTSIRAQLPKIGIQQRVLPDYRAPFFELLARSCQRGLCVFAGQPRGEELIQTRDCLEGAQVWPARNLHLLSGGLYLCWQGGLLAWLESWQPEGLVLEANPRYLSSYSAAKWMHQRGRKVIGWGLGVPAMGAKPGLETRASTSGGILSRMRKGLWKAFLGQFDALIAYSQTGAEQYRAAGAPAERVFVAPNAAAARPGHAFPERLIPGKGECLKALFVGRLQERKRIDLLLRACAELPADVQPDLAIVGEGPARGELELLAQELYPRARFTGARRGTDLEAEFRQADLFVLPGTGGLAVQQALGWGLPVMVAEADGTQADLVRPENGWILPPGDLAALRRALESALRNPGRLREMGAESYRIAAEEVNLERMVGVFEEVLSVAPAKNGRTKQQHIQQRS